MRIRLLGALLLCAVGAGWAQTQPQIRPDQQPDTQAFLAAVRALRKASKVGEETKAEADRLVSPAALSRQNLAHAYVLLSGEKWDTKAALAWSFELRPDRVIADSTLRFIARLGQYYPAWGAFSQGLTLKASLCKTDGALLRSIGSFRVVSKDLAEQPFGIEADLEGVQDGIYLLRAELFDGENALGVAGAEVQVVKGIERDRQTVEKRLAKVQGHESAKATVRYPYALAESVNLGRRRYSPSDFGLPFQPQPPYDFVKGIRASADLLQTLESGNDPLYRAKGDHERHYWFAEAGEMMAYHVYAPENWDGKARLPMVLVLHGNTRDQNYYFDRDDHILARLAEQHKYLVVCPMGYRPSAGWGSNSLNKRPGVPADPARDLQGELSEKDALNVLELVTKEYPVNPDRIYLFGHSAGGAGTWYLGEKYAERWAGIAASAAATRPDGFPFERLNGMSLMVCYGAKDDEVPVSASRNMVKAAKDHGLEPNYLEDPDGTHLTIVAIVEPKVFDFFDLHQKGK